MNLKFTTSVLSLKLHFLRLEMEKIVTLTLHELFSHLSIHYSLYLPSHFIFSFQYIVYENI